MRRELFRTRSYQRPMRAAYREGKRRFVCLWHRRAGKDRNAMAFTLERMLERVGVYFHVFPSLNQGRRDVWDNIVQQRYDGKEESIKMIDIFPKELLAEKPNESEMQIKLVNGSIYQIMGADNDEAVDRLRGPNPIGLIFSEYAHGEKMEAAWKTLDPVLVENGGWLVFAYTPNGLNHGEKLATMAEKNPNWFFQKLTSDDTRRDANGEDGTPVMSMEEIEKLRSEGTREEFIQQEYYCSFTGFLHGTIYGDLMLTAQEGGRIGNIGHIPTYPVGIILDLGADMLAAWFYQSIHGSIRFIDYFEKQQMKITDFARMCKHEKPYMYGRIVLPHDGGRGAEDTFLLLGFTNVQVAGKPQDVWESIDKVRTVFSNFVFDEQRCAVGIRHLQEYKAKFNDQTGVFDKKPVHDVHSHGADALRNGIEGGLEPLMFSIDMNKPVKVETDFDPRDVTTGVLS